MPSQGAVTCLYDSVISQGSTSILTVKMLIRYHPVYEEKGSCLSLCEVRVQLKMQWPILVRLVVDEAKQTGLQTCHLSGKIIAFIESNRNEECC